MTFKRVRNISITVVMLLVMTIIMVACSGGGGTNETGDGDATKPTSITVTSQGDKDSLDIDETLQLLATVSPSGADAKVTWSISGSSRDGASVATVSESGLLKAVSSGSFEVVATSVADTSVSGKLRMMVLDTDQGNGGEGTPDPEPETPDPEPETPDPDPSPEVPAPESVTLSSNVADDTIKVGETTIFSSEVLPADADQTVTYTSNNPSIATIDENSGEFVAVSVGEVEIIATSTLDVNVYETVTMTVYDDPVIQPEVITIIGANTLKINQTTKLSATVTPSDASQDIVWNSSNAAVATIGDDGTVTGLANGETNITATSVIDDTIVSDDFILTVDGEMSEVEQFIKEFETKFEALLTFDQDITVMNDTDLVNWTRITLDYNYQYDIFINMQIDDGNLDEGEAGITQDDKDLLMAFNEMYNVEGTDEYDVIKSKSDELFNEANQRMNDDWTSAIMNVLDMANVYGKEFEDTGAAIYNQLSAWMQQGSSIKYTLIEVEEQEAKVDTRVDKLNEWDKFYQAAMHGDDSMEVMENFVYEMRIKFVPAIDIEKYVAKWKNSMDDCNNLYGNIQTLKDRLDNFGGKY